MTKNNKVYKLFIKEYIYILGHIIVNNIHKRT